MPFYPPKDVCKQLVMTANVQLDYPYSADVNNTVVTDMIDVTATLINLKLILPNSQLTGPGFSIAFNNVGVNPFNIVLNDGLTVLYTLPPSNAIIIYLYDSASVNGNWRIVQIGGGISAISSLTVQSTDNSITVVGGNVTSPSGTVNVSLPTIISKITELKTFIPGFVAINPANASPWSIALLVGDSNITVTNGDAQDEVVIIKLDNIISVTKITSGNIVIEDSLITNTEANGALAITSNGANSHLNLNSVLIDVAGNMSNLNNISINGTFSSVNSAKAWGRFTNTSGTIALLSSYNIANVVYNPINFQYTVTFTTPMGNLDYVVSITCANNNSTAPLQTRMGQDIIRQLDSVTIVLIDGAGEMLVDIPEGVSIIIYSLN